MKREHSKEYERAKTLFRSFSGEEPQPFLHAPKPVVPNVGLLVGTCDGILYTTRRDGKIERYIHKFRASDKPLFVVSPDGKQLILLGGRFQFTERGIVDNSDPSS
jgi:hypothetical protein